MNLVLQAINALGSSMFANNALLGGEVRVRVWILLMANLDITLTPMLQKANKTYQKKTNKKRQNIAQYIYVPKQSFGLEKHKCM